MRYSVTPLLFTDSMTVATPPPRQARRRLSVLCRFRLAALGDHWIFHFQILKNRTRFLFILRTRDFCEKVFAVCDL